MSDTVSRWCLQSTLQSEISPLLTPPLNSPRDLSFVSGGTEESYCVFEIFMQHKLWWKSTFFLLPPFLRRKCLSGLVMGQKQNSLWMLGKCVRIRESNIPKPENLSARIPLHPQTPTQAHKQNAIKVFSFSCVHAYMCIHALLSGNDGWCAWNSLTYFRPLTLLHHLTVGIGGGPLTL